MLCQYSFFGKSISCGGMSVYLQYVRSQMMNYRHTKHTQTNYTDHIRPLKEKASILFFLSLRNKVEEDDKHISIYLMNLVNSLKTATFIPNRDQDNILRENSRI